MKPTVFAGLFLLLPVLSTAVWAETGNENDATDDSDIEMERIED